MGGGVRVLVGLFAVAFGLMLASVPAAAQTYVVTSYPYTADVTLGENEEFDSHEITAVVGKEISWTVRATSGGCVLVILTLGHNVNDESLYLQAYSQETCVPSFSKSYTVPSGSGPDFSIVVTTENPGAVAYHIDINVAEPSFLSRWGGLIGAIVLFAIIGAIIAAVRSRRRKAAPPVMYPPAYAPGPTQYPPPGPTQPAEQPPYEPRYPPPPP